MNSRNTILFTSCKGLSVCIICSMEIVEVTVINIYTYLVENTWCSHNLRFMNSEFIIQPTTLERALILCKLLKGNFCVVGYIWL